MKPIALLLALAWSLQPAAAMVRGTTDLGVPFGLLLRHTR
jgi:hypothetical protein